MKTLPIPPAAHRGARHADRAREELHAGEQLAALRGDEDVLVVVARIALEIAPEEVAAAPAVGQLPAVEEGEQRLALAGVEGADLHGTGEYRLMPDGRALYKEAFANFVKGRLDEAVAGYRAAVAAQPDLAIAWNGLAMVLAQQGDLDAAIEAARRLVELEPEDALGHTSLSIFYQRKGLIREAEDEKAIATRLAMRGS